MWPALCASSLPPGDLFFHRPIGGRSASRSLSPDPDQSCCCCCRIHCSGCNALLLVQLEPVNSRSFPLVCSQLFLFTFGKKRIFLLLEPRARSLSGFKFFFLQLFDCHFFSPLLLKCVWRQKICGLLCVYDGP